VDISVSFRMYTSLLCMHMSLLRLYRSIFADTWVYMKAPISSVLAWDFARVYMFHILDPCVRPIYGCILSIC